jgi:predicted acyltransferase
MTTVELPPPPAVTPTAPVAPITSVQPAAPPARLVSLDAFRGAIMLLMASAGFGLAQVAKSFPDSAVWRFIGYETEHADWNGCSLWDLIQPAFMFMVGIALPWSIANRQAKGEPFGRMFAHAVWRAVLLIVLAIIFTSAYSKQTEWMFTNVLAQIGLGYPLLFLLAFTGPRTPWVAAGAILAAYWLAFALHPLPPAGFDWASVGVPADWSHHFKGFAAHWEKNFNFAATFDQWFLNLFPRATGFVFSKGGYQTLNFIPSLATMTFGLIAGRLLRSDLALTAKLQRLVIAGLAGIALGALIDAAGLCPIVKRIWTPSWAIFSAGWVCLMLAGFVAIIEGRGWKRWAFPLVVVGLNPITLYTMFQMSSGFIRQELRIHFGQEIFASFGNLWVPALERGSVLLVMWLVVWWMYRRKIFLRL